MSSTSSSIAEQYARALVDILEGVPERERSECEEEIGALAKALAADAEARAFLASPVIDAGRKSSLLIKVLRDAKPLTRRFLEVLAARGRAELLPEIHAAAVRLSEERRGVLLAEVASAVPLSAETRRRCAEALEQASGRPVRLTERHDPRLIGGLRTQIGSRVFDGSVRGQLDLLRRKLTGD